MQLRRRCRSLAIGLAWRGDRGLASVAVTVWRLPRGSACRLPRRLFYHAYLVAFVFYLTITLGSLFFVLLHHLSRAGWSVTSSPPGRGPQRQRGPAGDLVRAAGLHLHEIYPWADHRPAYLLRLEAVDRSDRPRSAAQGRLPDTRPRRWLTPTSSAASSSTLSSGASWPGTSAAIRSSRTAPATCD